MSDREIALRLTELTLIQGHGYNPEYVKGVYQSYYNLLRGFNISLKKDLDRIKEDLDRIKEDRQ